MRGSESKWNCSDSSDSDYGQLMTPLTIAILDFHFVRGALSTATMTKTPSPVITSLLQKVMGFVKPEGEGGGGRKGRCFPKTYACFRSFERNIPISKI